MVHLKENVYWRNNISFKNDGGTCGHVEKVHVH